MQNTKSSSRCQHLIQLQPGACLPQTFLKGTGTFFFFFPAAAHEIRRAAGLEISSGWDRWWSLGELPATPSTPLLDAGSARSPALGSGRGRAAPGAMPSVVQPKFLQQSDPTPCLVQAATEQRLKPCLQFVFFLLVICLFFFFSPVSPAVGSL